MLQKYSTTGIATKMLMAAGDIGVYLITKLTIQSVREKIVPDEWLRSAIVTTYKGKGDTG